MATLLELKTIYDDAHSTDAEGVTPPLEVVQARELRKKVEAAVWKEAHALITSRLPPTGQPANEAIGWAQDALRNSPTVASSFLRGLLAANADATATEILGLGDSGIEGVVATIAEQLARGKHPGR